MAYFVSLSNIYFIYQPIILSSPPRNGTEVEGIEHEKFKELIRDSTDDLELVVITPIDAKMLDIPAGLVIHKSDGSKLSIDHSALLSSNNIEKVIQNRVKVTICLFLLKIFS